MKFLCVSSLWTLLTLSHANREDAECWDAIQVHRDTVHNVSLGENLEIQCPVQFCKNSRKIITWSKLKENVLSNAIMISSSHITTKLIMSSPLEGMSFLMFNNIQERDSGLYRCESGDSVSFFVNVSVSGCEHEIQVYSNRVYKVSVGESLKVPCPVKFCQNPDKTLTWFKLEGNISTNTRIINSSRISTELIMTSPLEGTLYLMFNNVQENDSGVYWCESGGTVTFIVMTSITGLSFLYSSLKIAAIVVLVIIVSAVSMRTCKRKPKEEHPGGGQVTELPMVDVSCQQGSLRGRSSVSPLCEASLRKTRLPLEALATSSL